MGRVYRETTPTMLARVTAALDERMGRAMAVAGTCRATPKDGQGLRLDKSPGAAGCRRTGLSGGSEQHAQHTGRGGRPGREQERQLPRTSCQAGTAVSATRTPV
jgi:hypothetical protein